MSHFLRPALIALILIGPTASAQPLPEGTTIHRKQAGVLDASGWTTAASSHGGFSVRLPLKFDDTTTETPNNSEIAKLFIVGGMNAKKQSFMAMKMQLRAKDAPKQFFARINGKETRSGFAIKRHVFQGRETADLSIKGAQASTFVRYVKLPDGVIMLKVDIPRMPRTVPPMAKVRKFFDSLRVSRPTKTRGPS